MAEPVKLFISYKTGPATGLTFQARAIRKELATRPGANYHVWLDKDDLEAGLDWNTQIYEEIPTSDILLLLLAEETATSDWVRREVDVAKGAQVTILPVLIRDFDGLQAALDRFDIPRLQAVSLFEGSDNEYDKLFAAIEQRKGDTAKAQEKLRERLGRGPKLHPFKKADPTHATFPREGTPLAKQLRVRVHVAAGSIVEMCDIDAFVNSENDYMQMARVFDDTTISSLLRYHGSHFDRARRLVDDTVQNELTAFVKAEYHTRPVGLGTVIVTSSGHPESRLVKRNRAKHIFHTAVVAVRDDAKGRGKELVPINDLGLRDAVRATLDRVDEWNRSNGKGAKAASKKASAPIRSIIFPLLGTGRGGLPPAKVASLMAGAIMEYILDDERRPPNDKTKLEHIHICAYAQEHAAELIEALEAEFEPKDGDAPEC